MIRLSLNIMSSIYVKHIIDMLFDTVMIDSGFALEEPSHYARRIYKLIQSGLSGEQEDLSGDEDEEEQDEEKPEAEEEKEPTSTMEEVD